MNLTEEIDLNNDNDNNDEDKIKNSSTDYGKIGAAIGKMKTRGLNFSLPDINKSGITFTPEIEENRIIYGLRGLTRIGNQLIKDIIINRPYTSIEDFLSKVKVNKLQMVALIKAGTFDSLYSNNRQLVMDKYMDLIADKKKRITLQNMATLISKNLIPNELDFERRLFNFNKYLKNFKENSYYRLDSIALKFFTKYYDDSVLESVEIKNNEQTALIKQSTWDNTYKKGIEKIRVWMRDNQEQILDSLNKSLIEETYNKYADGNISKWEMDSLSFYYHDHELAKLQNEVYGISDWNNLPTEPIIDRTFRTKDNKEITMFKITRIAGTVIDKDKNKSTVTLLTTSGVVVVKIWKNQYASWDKQISQRDNEGVKHILEKSWFTKGTKLIITGIRRGDDFVPKKYKSTEYPLFERIDELDDNGFILKSSIERIDEED